MRTIYIDKNFKCHLDNDGTMIAVETDFFDGKCKAFIEGYRFIPKDMTWTREDGEIFYGEMITPWRDQIVLQIIQSLFEETKKNETQAQADMDALIIDHEYRLTMLELGLI